MKYILISTVVDKTIQEFFRDINIEIFDNIISFKEHTEVEPVRCEKLFITNECLDIAPAVSLNTLIELQSSNFFKCEEVTVVAAPNAKCLPIIEFLVEQQSLKQPEIVTGSLTREFLVTVIRGLYKGVHTVTKVQVERMRRVDYINSELRRKAEEAEHDKMDNDLIYAEEQRLAEVADQEIKKISIVGDTPHARHIQIAGGKCRGKTTFLLLLAQFLSANSKVVILERDLEYFTLSHYIAAENLPCTKIDISEIYSEPYEVGMKIANSKNNLIAIVGTSACRRKGYSYSYVFRFISAMVSDCCDYFIFENSLEAISPTTKTVIVLQNNIISCLQDARCIPYHASNLDFVALSGNSIKTGIFQDSDTITRCMSELLNINIEPIPIYELATYKIGGPYDLYRFART